MGQFFKAIVRPAYVALIISSIALSSSASAKPLSYGTAQPGAAAFSFDSMGAPSQIVFTDFFNEFWKYNWPNYSRDILPVCQKESDSDCIQSVEARNLNGAKWEEFIPTTILHNVHVNRDSSQPYLELTPPNANFPYLWTGPESMRTEAGLNYLISGIQSGTGLNFRVVPVKAGSVRELNNGGGCLSFYQEFECVKGYNFPINVEIRMKVRLNKNLKYMGGWFQGSVRNPEIKSEDNKNYTLISLQGEPVYRPTAQVEMSTEEQINRDFYTICKAGQHCINIRNSGDLYVLKQFPNRLNEKSLGEASSWAFDSSAYSYLDTSGPCVPSLENGLTGYVFNNAAIYDRNYPTWNEEKSVLNYEVASPHLLSDGSVSVGYYQIAISQKAAECLWKVNVNRSQASVQILDSDGTSQVATSTLNVRDGYVYISVDGFHYSATQMSVTLKEVKITATPKATNTIKTIKCRKAKMTRIVTGPKPICPKGYAQVK
jgi:hypothetical protein